MHDCWCNQWFHFLTFSGCEFFVMGHNCRMESCSVARVIVNTLGGFFPNSPGLEYHFAMHPIWLAQITSTAVIAARRAKTFTTAASSWNNMVIMLSTEFSDMAFEMHRLMSFTSWPQKNVFPQPSALVSAGFYYTGEADRTKCFSCEGEVCRWTPDMYPDVIHRTRFPHCLLVKGEEARHKPMQPSQEVVNKVENFFKKKSVDLGFISRNTNIATQPSNPHGMTNPILVKSSVASRSSNSGLLSLTSPLSLTSTIDYCDMRYEEARQRSFAHWPKSDMIPPADLARAGMYFIGPGDRVQCAFCKGKLEGWMRGDNPLDEHKKHFGARCRFMQGAQVGNVPTVHGVSRAPRSQRAHGAIITSS